MWLRRARGLSVSLYFLYHHNLWKVHTLTVCVSNIRKSHQKVFWKSRKFESSYFQRKVKSSSFFFCHVYYLSCVIFNILTDFRATIVNERWIFFRVSCIKKLWKDTDTFKWYFMRSHLTSCIIRNEWFGIEVVHS